MQEPAGLEARDAGVNISLSRPQSLDGVIGEDSNLLEDARYIQPDMLISGTTG